MDLKIQHFSQFTLFERTYVSTVSNELMYQLYHRYRCVAMYHKIPLKNTVGRYASIWGQNVKLYCIVR